MENYELLNQGVAVKIDTVKAGKLREWGIGRILEIDASLLGVLSWEEMLSLTKTDNKERWLITSLKRGKILTDKIKVGDENSFTPSLFPQGFRSVHPLNKELVIVHTHPINQIELSRLSVVPISDRDITGFLHSDFRASVILDGKGIHLLTRDQYFKAEEKHELPSTIVDKAFNAYPDGTKKSGEEVQKETALELKKLGLRYYYSPYLGNRTVNSQTIRFDEIK